MANTGEFLKSETRKRNNDNIGWGAWTLRLENFHSSYYVERTKWYWTTIGLLTK